MHKVLPIIAFLMAYTALGQANKGDLSGTVRTHKGEPLPWATVVIKNTRHGVQTDENGNYRISNI